MVQPRSHRLCALPQRLGAIVEAVDGAGGEKIGQPPEGLQNITHRRADHLSLSCVVGSRGRRHFTGRRIKKRRLIGQQPQRQQRLRALRQVRVEPVQRRLRQALGKLYAADQPHQIRIFLVRRGKRGQPLLQLRHGQALFRRGRERHRCQ